MLAMTMLSPSRSTMRMPTSNLPHNLTSRDFPCSSGSPGFFFFISFPFLFFLSSFWLFLLPLTVVFVWGENKFFFFQFELPHGMPIAGDSPTHTHTTHTHTYTCTHAHAYTWWNCENKRTLQSYGRDLVYIYIYNLYIMYIKIILVWLFKKQI